MTVVSSSHPFRGCSRTSSLIFLSFVSLSPQLSVANLNARPWSSTSTTRPHTNPCLRAAPIQQVLLPVGSLHVPLQPIHGSQSAPPTDASATMRIIDILRGGDDSWAAAGVVAAGVELSDATELAQGAVDWLNNLGAPAALVAGAVIATIYETMHAEDLEIQKTESRLVRMAKKAYKLLLFFAFALEVMSIFVTTVTATLLLSSSTVPTLEVTAETNTPLSFLRQHYEFEYLTARICFLQGLLNWLMAIAISHALPSGETAPTRRMNLLVAHSLATLSILMVAFFNRHLSAYTNYFSMLSHWVQLIFHRNVAHSWPPPPLAFVIVPMVVRTVYLSGVALVSNDDEEHPVEAVRDGKGSRKGKPRK